MLSALQYDDAPRGIIPNKMRPWKSRQPCVTRESQSPEFPVRAANEYLWVDNSAKSFLARPLPTNWRNRGRRCGLRNGEAAPRRPFSGPKKFRKNCRIFPNPKPDTTLCAHEY
jgi:hypothetical protein